MLLVHCLFDYNKQPPRPLIVGVRDSDTGNVEVITLYLPKTGKVLLDIMRDCARVRELIETNEVVLSDFKSYISGFDLDPSRDYRVYDLCLEPLRKIKAPDTEAQAADVVTQVVESIAGYTPEYWQYVLSNVQLVYNDLEKRGVSDGVKILHPIYGMTFSGRSRTSGYNIQGATENDPIFHVNPLHNTFVHIDWVSADIRVAGLMSGDTKLNESFLHSDPYTYMAQELNHKDVTRDVCKAQLIASLYALDPDNPMLDFYGGLKRWMQDQKAFIAQSGYAESIFNRKFKLAKDRTDRSVFNAIVQGSVAHAMQLTLYKLFKVMASYVVTEIHDSVVLACEPDIVGDVIRRAVSIMQHPFEGVIEENPLFPLRVSVGYAWKQWRHFKEYR